MEHWDCLYCGTPATVEVEPMLDGTYGSARCMSEVCGRAKRVFHLEKEHPHGHQADHRGRKPPEPRRP